MAARLDRPTRVVVAVVVVAVLAAMFGVWKTRPDEALARPKPMPSGSPKLDLQFGVWGSPEEIKAYQDIVDDYNEGSQRTKVSIRFWPTAAKMVEAMDAGEADPDLYLLPRRDLRDTLDNQRNVPLLDLLDARRVNIGDDYSRDSVAAFSAEDNLQCMPYATSPMVIYYNEDLIDFDKMAARDLPVPGEDRTKFSFDQFRAAAEFASRPRKGTRGVYVDSTLEALAPFILSGGGELFDDNESPTRLNLQDGSSTEALRSTLEVLRDPLLTLSAKQLKQRSGLDWFKAGKVGMIAGYRSLTPELRDVEGLNFDVLPMPNLGAAATVGDLTGLCIGSGRPSAVGPAADFLVHLVSDDAVARIAETGYVQPTNLRVAYSDAFQQLGELPFHAHVFIDAVRRIAMMPLLDNWDALESAIGPQVRDLFTKPVLDDLGDLLTQIDDASALVLDPSQQDQPTESPSDGT